MTGWKNAGKRRVETGEYVEEAIRKLLGVERKTLTHQSRSRPDVYTGSVVGEIKAVEQKEKRINLTLEQMRKYFALAESLNRSSLDGSGNSVSVNYFFGIYDGSGETPKLTDVYVLGGRNLLKLKRENKVYGNYYIKDRVLMRSRVAQDSGQAVLSENGVEMPDQEARNVVRKKAYESNVKGLCIRFNASRLKKICRNTVVREGVPFHYDMESFKSSSA